MIKLISNIDEFNTLISSFKRKDIGLVPTMGNLHEGHLSLVKKSISENKVTIVTIFVNPKQFGPNEDYEKYPRTLKQDYDKLESLYPSDKELIVFAPSSANAIFPENFTTEISVTGITEILCGKTRPDHFSGVTTVVHRLLTLSKAQNSYFGQKDFQQVKVIERMVENLGMDVRVNIVQISRDEDGLAQSSRNQYLSREERNDALTLPQTINKIVDILSSKSWIDSQVELNSIIEEVGYTAEWEYLEILDSHDLSEININTTEVVIAGAFKKGDTRLIDNQLVKIRYA